MSWLRQPPGHVREVLGKAKSEFPVQSRSTPHFSDEVAFFK
jgi:hypothetical protein